MLKKVLSVMMCCALTVPVLTSCGKEVSVDEKGSPKDSIANFTAPKEGEQVIIMKVKDYGEIKIKLFPEYADKGVENFVELAKKGYYDGLTFHRIIQDFMIQGGDPLGTGYGGTCIWGDKFDGGTDAHLINCSGSIAYANSGSTSTNGSQFYINTGSPYTDADFEMLAQRGMTFSNEAKEIYKKAGGSPSLDGGYTVFGQVYDGLDIAYKLSQVETYTDNSCYPPRENIPVKDVIMESVTVGEYDGGEIRWYIDDYQ